MSVLEHVVKRPRHGTGAMDAEAAASDGVLWVRNRAGKMVALPVGMGDGATASRPGDANMLGASSLAPSIPAGMRAVTVTFAEGVGSGGPLVQGDHIDIIATFTKEVMGKDQAIFLLQDVLVLAVVWGTPPGESTPSGLKARLAEARRALAGVGAEGVSSAPVVQVVTLAVTPEAVQRLALAEDLGRLRYALRGASQDEGAPSGPVSVRQLLRRRHSRPSAREHEVPGAPSDPTVDGGPAAAVPAAPADEAPAPTAPEAASDSALRTQDSALEEAPAPRAPELASGAMLAAAPGRVAMVTLDQAHARSAPSLASSVVGEAEYGDELEVLGQSADWFKVRLPDEREGWMAGGWIAVVKRERGDDVSP